MKMKMKMRMLGAVIILFAMLVGSSANAQVSTIKVDGFLIEEDVVDGKDVLLISFEIKDVVSIKEGTNVSLKNVEGDYETMVSYIKDYTTDVANPFLVIDSEAYSVFLIEGIGSLDLGNNNVFYFDEIWQDTLHKFLSLRSTELREGEKIEGE